MMNGMALVFQYGSNTRSERLNADDRLRGDARPVGIACTKDRFELDFNVWSHGNQCAAADLVPGVGRSIWGVLYEIPDYLIRRETARNRKSLDAIEGEGTNYKRIEIDLTNSDGESIQVMTYVVINKVSGRKTSLEYASHIVIGLREHNVPSEYIDYVKARIVANNPILKDDIDAL
jgi:hypothetical protein